jgi:hypothetical protein
MAASERFTHRDLEHGLVALTIVQHEAIACGDWRSAAWALVSVTLLRAIANLDELATQARAEMLLLPEWAESDEPSKRPPPAGIVALAERATRINTYRGQN